MKSIDRIILNDGQVLEDERDIANAFNKYFSNVGTMVTRDINILLQITHRQTNSIYLSPVDPLEIVSTLNTMQKKKSAGLDGLNSASIKQLRHVLSNPLAVIINVSFGEGIFPNILKTPLLSLYLREVTQNL